MSFAWVVLTNLLRRPSRTCFTVFGLALSIAATASLIAVGWGYADSQLQVYGRRGIDIILVRAGVAERATSSLRGALVDRLKQVPHVARVDVGLMESLTIGSQGSIGVPIRGVDPHGFSIGGYQIESGRALAVNQNRELMLGAGLANGLKKKVGESVEVEGESFQVVGIYRGVDALESNTAAMKLSDLQALVGREDQVSEIYIDAGPEVVGSEQLQEVCRSLESLRDPSGNPLGFRAMTTGDFTTSATETRLLNAMALGTSVLAALLAAVGMLNTMLMSVLERVTEFGVLRALGWPRRRLMRMVLGEAIVLWGVAAIIGILLAAAVTAGLALLPMTRTMVGSRLPLGSVAVGSLVGLVATLIGAFFPALWSASIQPREAIHDE